MKERPILFSATMVRAVLDDSKTQTRRVLRGPTVKMRDGRSFLYVDDALGLAWRPAGGDPLQAYPNVEEACPYGVVGDQLWVRESYAPRYFDDGKHGYMADWTGEAADMVPKPRWTPSIHMPRAHSRITLEITDVRVQRLQSISEADARAEGCPGVLPIEQTVHDYGNGYVSARVQFKHLWDAINGEREGYAWDANPRVWALTFKRLETKR
jgi:hypothetical protein